MIVVDFYSATYESNMLWYQWLCKAIDNTRMCTHLITQNLAWQGGRGPESFKNQCKDVHTPIDNIASPTHLIIRNLAWQGGREIQTQTRVPYNGYMNHYVILHQSIPLWSNRTRTQDLWSIALDERDRNEEERKKSWLFSRPTISRSTKKSVYEGLS